jgi:excinuclease ABC subunit C
MKATGGDVLKAKLANLPVSPGVYMFKDAKGKVLYVGKAKSLKSRVRSYFGEGGLPSTRTEALVKSTRDLDIIVTHREVEALILEANLIKHFRPRYNINLRDDKKFPFMKVTTREPFPSIYPTRNLKDESARYFGPYTDARAMRKTLKILTEAFPVRTCKRRLPLKQADRGCLKYYIGKCIGPCRGEISSEEYKGLVQQVCQFLSGRMTGLTRDLKARMEAESEHRNFEEAARLRDRLQAVSKVAEKQTVVWPSSKDRDVAVVRSSEGHAVGLVLKVREGNLIGKEMYQLSFEGSPDEDEILGSFLGLYLGTTTLLPQEILLERLPADADLLSQWLSKRTNTKVGIKSPRSGKGRELLEMAGRNAEVALSQITDEKPRERIAASVTDLAKWLHLPDLPLNIAAFDISTTQGSFPVGSSVFFRNGRPLKSRYRKFSIRTVEGQDDFAMMREVIRRYWTPTVSGEEEAPDLLIIDGGKGQLSSAIKGVVDAGGHADSLPAMVAIAKRFDEIYVPDREDPLQIPHTSPALRLIQKIRDEAHRFAVTYHRKLRTKQGMKSELETVSGIGPILSKRLLREFGTLRAVRDADVEELAKVRGMTRTKAEAVLRAFGRTTRALSDARAQE